MDSESVKVLSALLAPTVAVVAVYIAWRQHATARDHLKLALFDRRYAVYRGVLDLFSVAASFESAETVTKKDIQLLSFTTHQRRFLFGNDVADFIEQAREKAVRLMLVEEHRLGINPDKNEAKWTELTDDKIELQTWFRKELPNIAEKFQPYFGFKKNL